MSSASRDVDFLSFGDFGGLDGQLTVATLHFDTLGLGTSGVSASIENNFSDGSGTPLSVSIAPSQVTVVPEPGTLALFSLDCLGLALLRGRR